MTEKNQDMSKELSTSSLNAPSLSNNTNSEIERSVTEAQNSTAEQQESTNGTRLDGDEWRISTSFGQDESSLEDDPRRRPGAHAIRGVNADLCFSSSESSSSSSSEEQALTRRGVLWTAQDAHVVDEAAEKQRRQEYEREKQRNHELESQMRRIESEAVVAIPMGRNQRRKFGGSVLGLVVAVIVALLVGVLLGNGSSDKSANVTMNRPTDQPTSTPTEAATDSTESDSTWNQVGQTLEGKTAGDEFGDAVALSGNGTVVVGGGPRNDDNGWFVGHVRVFEYDSGFNGWKRMGQDLTGKSTGDEFGASVALSNDGNIVAAGAITYPDGNGYIKVHTFDSSTSEWRPMGQDLEGRAPRDWFGFSTAMSADGAIVAAGGPGRLSNENEYSGNKTGYVQVLAFNYTTVSWVPMGQDLNGTGIGDAFGWSVALSANGTILAVGADHNIANGQYAGRVQVFHYDSSTDHWEQVGQDLVGKAARDGFGNAVALSEDGTILAVGAFWNDGVNGSNTGHVEVYSYDRVNSRWAQLGNDINGESDGNLFGRSVALSADGMTVAAGAIYNDGQGGEHSGHVRVFSYDTETKQWNQVGRDLDGKAEYDQFGISVALSSDGTKVAAGASFNDGNGADSGHVRVFEAPESQ